MKALETHIPESEREAVNAFALRDRLGARGVKALLSPEESLGAVDVETVARILTASNDVCLVVDAEGVIQDLAFGGEGWSLAWYRDWLGKPWIDTVTLESRPKVEALLERARRRDKAGWRQINHPSPQGGSAPVLYTAVDLAHDGKVLATGRDLRDVAALQQRMIDAQNVMEREYSSLRRSETRYRALFRASEDAVVFVDAANRTVLDANPAAEALFAKSYEKLVGRTFPFGLSAEEAEAVATELSNAIASGDPASIEIASIRESDRLSASISVLGHGAGSDVIVRFEPIGRASPIAKPRDRAESKLVRAFENASDAFVVTSVSGHVLRANAAFLEMAQAATEAQVRGMPIDTWFGRSSVDFGVITANLRQRSSVRLFSTVIRGGHGARRDVEISATAANDGGEPFFAFVIRDVELRASNPERERATPRSIEHLTELVGRVPLKTLVKETSDLIERMCIEAALEITSDNRAAAAEILGLSRQSLYVKLKRYGMGDLDGGGYDPANDK